MSVYAKFVQGKPLMTDYSSGASAVAAGAVVVINGAVRIAHVDAVLSADGTNYNQMALAAGGGVYDGLKDGTAAVSFADGDPVFWSAGTSLFTATSSDTFAGYSIGAFGATTTRERFVHVIPGTIYSGNIAASGTFAAAGNATFAGTLQVTTASATTLGGSLAVTGVAAFTATVTVGTRLLVSATNTGVTATASTYTALTTNKDIVPLIGVTGQTAYGWKLPTGVAGMQIRLINTTAFAGVLVPASGGTINGLAANAPVVIAASKSYLAVCTAADTWWVVESTIAAAG